MVEVNVRLFATLREGRFRERNIEITADASVKDIINQCKIPPGEVAICMVNGRHADGEQLLQNGDTVAIFPPVGGG